MKRTEQPKGFTIVEMLTVMGIIAVLIGLLIPALSQVKDYSKQIQQKSQFHSINVALEMFKAEFGSYPESNGNVDLYNAAKNHPNDASTYSGANKMAEALVGLDMLGFHPNSDFRSTGINSVVPKLGGLPVNMQVYHAYDDAQAAWENADENLKARKGPFIESENANAFRMDEIYPVANLPAQGFSNNYAAPGGPYYPLALCDIFSKKRVGTGSKKTGMPILYYRARTINTQQSWNNPANPPTVLGGLHDDIYYYPDNQHILNLGTPELAPVAHPVADGANDYLDFENMILNKQVTTVNRPYRAGSYILISAGKDGLYGTADDVFNFDKGTEQ